VRLAFAGSPAAALPALQALLRSRHEVVAVITRPPRRSGRGRRDVAAPVAALAAEAGLPVFNPERAGDPAFLGELAALAVDCAPVVAYGALLPPAALTVPRHGWVNLHFSLLPAWRGAAPVQHAILAGDDVTGASTFQIETGLDTGPVFGLVTESIRAHDTAGDLLERLARSGAELLVATMDGIEAGTLVPQPQPADGVSVAGKITVADAEIDWSTPALRVDRLVRAMTPAPGAWTIHRGERLKLGPVQPLDDPAQSPGSVNVDRDAVVVGTATTPVRLSTVQPAGRRPMAAPDWARGAHLGADERLG
jgi:methionyl-tRNA formyltransferase